MNALMPGPCRPIELSMPLGVSAMRGVARPDRGAVMIDLVTTAPSCATSKNWFSSRPAAEQPDAVSTGFGSRSAPSRAVMSTLMSVTAPHCLGADEIGRQGPDVGPSDVQRVEDRTVHARAHEAGLPVRPPHRQHAGHADADATRHRLLDRHL